MGLKTIHELSEKKDQDIPLIGAAIKPRFLPEP
jgi:hypothetical protein